MKKIVKLFGVMTIAAALLISCKQPTNPDDGTNSDTNTEQTGGTGAGNTDDKKDDATGGGKTDDKKDETPEVKDLVVFEGEEILEPSAADGNNENYGNYVVFKTPVTAGSGYTKFEVTLSWDGDTAKQCVAQLMNDNDQASAAATSTTKDSSTISGACFVGAKYQKWVDGKAQDTDCADGATKLQVFMQNADYKATNGKITVTKIVLKK